MEWSVVVPVVIALSTTIGGFIWSNRAQISELRVAQEELRGMVERRFATAREERITQIAHTQMEAKKYADDHRRAMDMGALALQTQIQQFQLKVADEYVRERSLRETESRIMAALEKMAGQVERLINRGNET